MIQLKGITKNYVMGENVVHALKGIDIEFRRSEFVAILGPSGGGKTTLLNIIGGLDQYTTGDLIINGKSTVDFKDHDWDSYRNHSVGFVFQSYNLIPHQNVLANVELALTISGVSKSERKARAIQALKSVGLEDQLYKRPNQLSGGQMQRVAIARAIVNNPDILLADEPTGALDTENSIQIMDILKDVAKDRLVVMVTHNPELAEQYATRIVRIKDGLLLSDTNPYHETDQTDTFKIGKAKMNFITALGLSLNNLLTKKGRTILTAFAGSIGIIGIALILSLSTGVNDYIDDVQANSLSSYPLTIQDNTADFTALMDAMMQSISSSEKVDGSINETPLVQNMFSNIGKNNLKAFKSWLQTNHDQIDPLVTTINYSYGVGLYIYKDDTSKGVVQLSPSTLMNSMGMGSFAGRYSGSDTFQKLTDDRDLLYKQYDVLTGRWPENYDECVMILSDPYTITDYMVYNLGIRDPQELADLITHAFQGENIRLDNTNMVFDYDDFMNMSFRVVVPADMYRYNDEYAVWEDMSKDGAYMKQVLADSLEMKIVGIVVPSGNTSSVSLSPGIGYDSSLMEYIIRQANNRTIIQQQLADRDTDVFSGRSFDDVNTGANSDLDFSDMISIDQNMLQKAFSGGVDTNVISATINRYVNQALNSVTTDTSQASQDMGEAYGQLATGMLNYYIENHGLNGSASYVESDITTMVSEYLADESAQVITKPLAEKYEMSQQQVDSIFQPLLSGMASTYLQASLDAGLSSAPLTTDNVAQIVTDSSTSQTLLAAMAEYASSLTENQIRNNIATAITNMTTEVMKDLSSAYKVDTNALAQAFSFNMNQEEMERLITAYMNTGSTKLDATSNLTKLGYGNLEEPTLISIYFDNFENKDLFKDLIKNYNADMDKAGRETDIISYTDITGTLMSSITTIINAISYVLIAFVSVSLVVSSIMIGIITYISVLERTKEIGVLRSLGASKRDVGHVFSAETFIIGLISGLLGVVVTILLCIPISMIVRSVTDIPTLTAKLPSVGGMVLILISVILTLIAGLIPSNMATKCDPVVALRSE